MSEFLILRLGYWGRGGRHQNLVCSLSACPSVWIRKLQDSLRDADEDPLFQRTLFFLTELISVVGEGWPPLPTGI